MPPSSEGNLYRSKPVIITAVQLRWSKWNEVCELLGMALLAENPNGAREIGVDQVSDTCGEPGPQYISLLVRTMHGDLTPVRHGDWIILDGKPGTFYPCKPEIFSAKYEAVDDPSSLLGP